MEVNYYCLERIHQQISAEASFSSRKHDLVQNYSERMAMPVPMTMQAVTTNTLNDKGYWIQNPAAAAAQHNVVANAAVNAVVDDLRRKETVNKTLQMKPSIAAPGPSRAPPPIFRPDQAAHQQNSQQQQQAQASQPPSKGFACPCGKTLSSAASLTRHQKEVHLNERKYPCSICSKPFKSVATMNRHISTVHSGKKHRCDLCNVYLSSGDSLARHRKGCSSRYVPPPPVYDPPTSKKKKKSKNFHHGHGGSSHLPPPPPPVYHHHQQQQQQQQQQQHHQQQANEADKKFFCDICRKGFTRQYTVKSHKEEVHFGTNNFQCPKCNKQYKNKRTMKSHEKKCGKIITTL